MNLSSTFPLPDFKLRNLISVPLALLGIFGNLLLAVTLIRPNSELNSTRNRSLFLLACLDLLCCLVELECDLEAMIPSRHWMSHRDCLEIQTPGLFFYGVENFLVWVIAVDRAMALKWPLDYDISTKIKWARRSLVLAGVCYSLSLTAFAWHKVDEKLRVPLCHPSEAISPAQETVTPIMLFLYFLVVSTHIYTYHLSTKLGSEDERAKRIQQSILIVAVVYIGTWLVTVSIFGTMLAMGYSKQKLFSIIIWAGLPARVSFGSNFYIFGMRSSQFRTEYSKTLAWIRAGCKYNNNVVIPFSAAVDNDRY